MLIIYIAGGLGDQMSRYALGRYFAIKQQAELFLDTSFYSSKHNYSESDTRVFALHHFQITAPIATSKQIKKLTTNRYLRRLGLIKSSHIINKADLDNLNPAQDYYLELSNLDRDLLAEISSVLARDFSLKNNSVLHPDLQEWLATPCVALHCRRGDKANNPKVRALHGVCSVDYYQRAMTELEKRLGTFNLLVFSDDPAWVKANLHFSCPVKFAADYYQVGHEYEELILMSQCHHQIISNSSFSWWAAWLNANPDKLVIAPQTLTADKSLSANDNIPSSWLRL